MHKQYKYMQNLNGSYNNLLSPPPLINCIFVINCSIRFFLSVQKINYLHCSKIKMISKSLHCFLIIYTKPCLILRLIKYCKLFSFFIHISVLHLKCAPTPENAIHHFCIIRWFPALEKSILEKQVTRTPLTFEVRGVLVTCFSSIDFL